MSKASARSTGRHAVGNNGLCRCHDLVIRARRQGGLVEWRSNDGRLPKTPDGCSRTRQGRRQRGFLPEYPAPMHATAGAVMRYARPFRQRNRGASRYPGHCERHHAPHESEQGVDEWRAAVPESRTSTPNRKITSRIGSSHHFFSRFRSARTLPAGCSAAGRWRRVRIHSLSSSKNQNCRR